MSTRFPSCPECGHEIDETALSIDGRPCFTIATEEDLETCVTDVDVGDLIIWEGLKVTCAKCGQALKTDVDESGWWLHSV